MGSKGEITLRGVAVHNLKDIDLDLPRRKLIVLCGLSGSGKTSLAIDTLYAEGQRRFIETFSAYTRQFLEQCDKPEAELIEGIPPAIAVTRGTTSRSNRSTVGTVTETNDYLRLLFAKIGRIFCDPCGREVHRENPQSIADELSMLPAGTRYMIGFEAIAEESSPTTLQHLAPALREDGFTRVIHQGQQYDLRDSTVALPSAPLSAESPLLVVVDRLTAGTVTPQRLRDSLELTFYKGRGKAWALFPADFASSASAPNSALTAARPFRLDNADWLRRTWSNELRCDECGRVFLEPESKLFSFNNPWGACPRCEGFGNIVDIDMDLIVPDVEKTLRGGAIAPWRTPAYEHELTELLALAADYDLPTDVPYRHLTPEQKGIIEHGVPERNFGGLQGFFAWLERRKYKTHIRAFMSRWRTFTLCPECNGKRLRPEALAVKVGGHNIADVATLKIADASEFFRGLQLNDWERKVGRTMLEQVVSRLGFLEAVGLGYLTLDRALHTLSGGEAQRVALTSALGSSLVNMLYVLDEPSVGLHPRDTDRLIGALKALRDRGNSVVAVEHEESVIRAADQIVEIGPGAGEHGGRVVFQGTPAEMVASSDSLTGDYLANRRLIRLPTQRRPTNHGWIRLTGARGHNLKNVSVDFPLNVLCMVTGVSGSGKSSLVQDTLYPALCRRLHKEGPRPLPFEEITGTGRINDVVLVDQSPIGRSPRSNPVTYVKAFDEIRAVFAETIEARTRNYSASHFSFNSEDGRCPTCKGDGHLAIDMQFLADVYMRCPTCRGTRYRREILDIHYRHRNIAEVLALTVREAFSFFRGSPKVQARLKRLMDVGLDYLRLGQPANTLSGGEAQRLKLAGYLSAAARHRVLFILDEPTTGLHFADLLPLVDCFDALLAAGHSLIVVEHNLQLIKIADHLIDLGPDAADAGGNLVATGTPEEIAAHPTSFTGQFLARALAECMQPAG